MRAAEPETVLLLTLFQLHVYQVSPALTAVEKLTARKFANLFGFKGTAAGGITCPGGSASNHTSLVIARNTLFPETKQTGNGSNRFTVFTSAHSHYSVRLSASACGLGAENVISVPVDSSGRMQSKALGEKIAESRARGETPLYVNATAGTTVLGSYDPLEEIGEICKREGLWMHIDASWGGPAIFSEKQSMKLKGSGMANSLTVNPHKMLNVPVTCSFLLAADLGVFHKANGLGAAYLFHGTAENEEVWDLADLTMQCGRRGDSLKLALAWVYHGFEGLQKQIDHAFDMSAYLATQLSEKKEFVLVSQVPPPCLQVCFYHAKGGELSDDKEVNSARTRELVHKLVGRGFMVDYAPGDKGSFVRVVVNCQTLSSTVDGLVKGLVEVAREAEV